MYQTIVIGGGPSGLMAAISASEQGGKVLLIDKKDQLGRKLQISGGGRCNVTNRLPYEEIIKNIPGNGKFLYSAFNTFDNESIIQYFESKGVKLKEEDNGRMFPVSNNAKDVVTTLLKHLEHNQVEIKTNLTVNQLLLTEEKITGVDTDRGIFQAESIIIATGGKSVPQTGSTGDGYRFAMQAGHTITELFPTEVPITSNEPFIKSKVLQGLSLQNVALSVLRKNGKPAITHQMDMLFTHFGLSGPAALRCSQFVYKEQQRQKKQDVLMMIDCFPEESLHELTARVNRLLKDQPDKAIKNSLKGLVHERYLLFLLQQAGIDETTSGHHLKKEQLTEFITSLKQFSLTVNGTLSIEKAFVTGGGVSVKEIHPATMQSKLHDNLFFCGEVLDIHGYTGGYNITSALVTGYVAGLNAQKTTSH
ncbi:NAD(P)/FAD-dependent oxidoreductase [Macrococcus hajekii]|uniref:NAD(P)/FAD-dependent oxidoreductase n=1 Tax=Macrococcus hajekii TaxID=198482 RepID=A0A4R6BLI1_9STAP|nr:NAD(P)/FAD-dependent oxidoreductase [Macrococcus hajekii]TDM02650.1 NAD(P)/FAD-dependent oxidoreductase [Macrococcus hajekii]GGB02769.1 NAD(FAD)-utilizing dehydrogenase [Macrococcus hajekii]